MKKRQFEKPLYRKVNTRTRGVHHGGGKDYRHQRNTKREKRSKARRGTMRRNSRNGLDYTPLFQFLLSRVGEPWDEVFSEATRRLDRQEPIFWMVAQRFEDRSDFVRIGESTFYHGMYVDDEGLLQLVNPETSAQDIPIDCDCCTYTFNGSPVKR